MQRLNLFIRKIHLSKEIFLFIILIIILLYPLLLYPYSSIFPQTDINIYSAWKQFLVESFKAYGNIPLWNPYLFGGAPFIGNSQVGIFYPINILYFILPIDRVFGYIFFLDYIFIGLFTYAYARLIKLSKLSALISAICITFNGAIMKQLFLGHIVIMDSIVWFPLLLYLYEKFLQKRLAVYAVFSGIVFGVMLLAGNVQIPLYALIAASIYFFIRIFQEHKANLKSIKKVIFLPLITLIIGLSLFAIQLLPTFEFSQLSVRSHGVNYQFASDFSFNPKQLPVIIFPSLFGSDINSSYWGIGSFWSSSIYAGVIPFFLALIALLYKRNKYTYALFSIALFSILYSFGKYGPFFGLFYKYIPFFNNFRVPTRFLFVYAFSFSILAGFGTEFILENFKKKKHSILNKFNLFISFVLTVTFSIYLLLYIGRNNIKFFEKNVLKNSYAQGINHNSLYHLILNDILVFCIFTLLILIMFILMQFKKMPKKIFYILLIVFILIDYFTFYTKFYFQNTLQNTYNYSKEISFLKNDKTNFRIFPMSNISADITSKNKLYNITGYDPLYLNSYRNFLWDVGTHENIPYESYISINKIENINNLRLLNVKYIISQTNIKTDFTSKVFQGKYNIYKINNFLPRAFIIYAKTPNFSIENLNHVKEEFISSYQPNKISLKVHTDKSGYLILSEIYYPGWVAYDNNKFTEIFKSNKIFRALYVTKGDHEIVFKYDPQSYKIGRIITLITILTVIIFLIYSKKRKLSL